MTDENQQPILEVYDPIKPVQEAIDSLQRQQKVINSAMVGVVIVITLGFVAIIVSVFSIYINHQDYTAQKYSEYIKLIEEKQKNIQNEIPWTDRSTP